MRFSENFNLKRYIFLFVFFVSIFTSAQYNEYEPEYNWLTIKGEHVYVHYHEEAERTARVVAKIGDEVWDPITSLYEFSPETVHYVIKDIDDYSNGATYFFDNKIEIWASALDFDLRGAHNWLRNVISHEFTHMVQIQAAMKMGRALPAFYFQFLNYEDKRRPDILYGFPNAIVSYPLATINMPAWFAEGTAQYMRKEFNYDNWDSHRDMILRSYVLDDKMLTWNQMGVFGKTSLGNESVYNSGFALTRYIAQKYGEDKLRKITKKLGVLTNFTIDQAFEQVLGKNGDELYKEWKDFLTADYEARTSGIKNNVVDGKVISSEGFGNFYPVFSQDEKSLFYLSNKGRDYLGQTSLYRYNLKTGKEEKLIPRVKSTIGLIPGTDKLVFSQLSYENPNWTNIHDLYIYDIGEEEDKRITFGMRANNPSVSEDGKMIAFVFQKDGTSNIGVIDIDGNNFKQITLFANGEQVFNPKFVKNDTQILFDYSYHHTRDIAIIGADGAGFEFLIQTGSDERNGVLVNENLYYSSDRTGIFNLYKRSMNTGEEVQITNVLGGAFMPAVNSAGTVAYAGYTSDGYKLFTLNENESDKVIPGAAYKKSENPPLNTDKLNGDIGNFDINYLANFNDRKTPDYDVNN